MHAADAQRVAQRPGFAELPRQLQRLRRHLVAGSIVAAETQRDPTQRQQRDPVGGDLLTDRGQAPAGNQEGVFVAQPPGQLQGLVAAEVAHQRVLAEPLVDVDRLGPGNLALSPPSQAAIGLAQAAFDRPLELEVVRRDQRLRPLVDPKGILEGGRAEGPLPREVEVANRLGAVPRSPGFE